MTAAPPRPYEQRFNGRTWEDMPGASPGDKKMNFALFRRGLFTVVDNEDWNEDEAEEGTSKVSKTISAQGLRARRQQASKSSNFATMLSPAKRLAALREAEERRRLAAIQLPGPPRAEEEDPSPPPPANEPEPTPPAMKTDNSARHQQLLARYKELNASQPHGFVNRFRSVTKFSTSTMFSFTSEKRLGNGALDRIEAALDDTSWLNESNPKPRKPRLPRAYGDTSAPAPRTKAPLAVVTINDVKAAIDAYESAKARLSEVAEQFAKQVKHAA